jgi:hypothetical protein
VEVLTVSPVVRLNIDGGIKPGRGNAYLNFALPSVLLENATGVERVLFNDAPLRRQSDSAAHFLLPDNLPVERPLKIKVFCEAGGDPLIRVIKVVEPALPGDFSGVMKRGADGAVHNGQDSEEFASGSIVTCMDPDSYGVCPQVLPTHLSSRIVFVGSTPGQIADWPKKDNLPSEWQPVWALSKEGKNLWHVHYCGGTDALNAVPRGKASALDKKEIKRWKEAVWVNRKINVAPVLASLRKLWRKYEEAARHA